MDTTPVIDNSRGILLTRVSPTIWVSSVCRPFTVHSWPWSVVPGPRVYWSTVRSIEGSLRRSAQFRNLTYLVHPSMYSTVFPPLWFPGVSHCDETVKNRLNGTSLRPELTGPSPEAVSTSLLLWIIISWLRLGYVFSRYFRVDLRK